MNKPFDYQVLGLTARDMRVYEALLEHATVASVRSAADWTGMNRGVVFESIKQLTERGLLSASAHGKQKRYYANDPGVLKLLARHKQEEIAAEQPAVAAYVDVLRSRGKTVVPAQFAAMYEGEEEIAALLRDVLATITKQPTKSYCIISAADIRGYLYKKFANFTRQRVKMGISVRSLGTGSVGDPAPLSERKTLPTHDLHVPACYVIIYGDKVAQISLHDNFVPYGIVVNNRELAGLQQLLFDQLWQSIQ